MAVGESGRHGEKIEFSRGGATKGPPRGFLGGQLLHLFSAYLENTSPVLLLKKLF